MLARRLNGKYLTPQAQHLLDRVKEISEGKYDDAMKAVMSLSDEDIREKYNTREIEK